MDGYNGRHRRRKRESRWEEREEDARSCDEDLGRHQRKAEASEQEWEGEESGKKHDEQSKRKGTSKFWNVDFWQERDEESRSKTHGGESRSRGIFDFRESRNVGSSEREEDFDAEIRRHVQCREEETIRQKQKGDYSRHRRGEGSSEDEHEDDSSEEEPEEESSEEEHEEDALGYEQEIYSNRRQREGAQGDHGQDIDLRGQNPGRWKQEDDSRGQQRSRDPNMKYREREGYLKKDRSKEDHRLYHRERESRGQNRKRDSGTQDQEREFRRGDQKKETNGKKSEKDSGRRKQDKDISIKKRERDSGKHHGKEDWRRFGLEKISSCAMDKNAKVQEDVLRIRCYSKKKYEIYRNYNVECYFHSGQKNLDVVSVLPGSIR